MTTRHRRRRSATGILIPGAFLVLASCATAGRYSSIETASAPTGGNYITAEDIQRYPSSVSVEEIIERYSPGIWLRRRHEPGGEIAVNMLGLGPPLFVIDGVPLEEYRGTLGINPRDVATIQIWKHGAQTALYGLRGANGVVLIKTKRGEE